MALLVFLTFLTLFTNSYVPVWMVDNERTHMNQVMNQFGEMKGKVDMLTLNAYMTGMTDLNMYQSIDLGADGIPVFAAPTASILGFYPYTGGTSSCRVNFTYWTGLKQVGYDQTGGGMVQLYAPNRYYVQQWVTYENGAIVLRQEDGQAMRAFPSLDLSKPTASSMVNVTFTQVDFVGVNNSVAGTSNAGLNLDLIYLDRQVYDNGSAGGIKTPMPIVLEFETLNGRAWYNYLRQYLQAPGGYLVNNTDYVLTHSADYYIITLELLNVSYFRFNRAITQVSFEVS